MHSNSTFSVGNHQGKSKRNHKPKRKKYQSTKDYLIMLNNSCCTYCGNPFKKEELCLVTKNHTWNGFFEPPNNKVIACKSCSSKKSGMNHKEFKRYLWQERMKLRTEIVENYPELASEVFNRYNYKCIYCEFEFGYTPESRKRRLTIDHKKPLIRQGDNDEQNLASACKQHNKEKGPLKPQEFFDKLEALGRKHACKKTVTKNKNTYIHN